ncbi:hypothetical protein SB772_13225 [Paraburkholderia sp. SIMBA_030]
MKQRYCLTAARLKENFPEFASNDQAIDTRVGAAWIPGATHPATENHDPPKMKTRRADKIRRRQLENVDERNRQAVPVSGSETRAHARGQLELVGRTKESLKLDANPES